MDSTGFCGNCGHFHEVRPDSPNTKVIEPTCSCGCTWYTFGGPIHRGKSWQKDHADEAGAAATVEHKRLRDERATLKARLVDEQAFSTKTIMALHERVAKLEQAVTQAALLSKPLLTIALAGNRASAHPAMLKGLREISEALSVE